MEQAADKPPILTSTFPSPSMTPPPPTSPPTSPLASPPSSPRPPFLVPLIQGQYPCLLTTMHRVPPKALPVDVRDRTRRSLPPPLFRPAATVSAVAAGSSWTPTARSACRRGETPPVSLGWRHRPPCLEVCFCREGNVMLGNRSTKKKETWIHT